MDKGRGAYMILVGRPEGRRPLGRPWRRWDDNIKMDLQDVGWGMGWIDMAQDRDRWRALVNVINQHIVQIQYIQNMMNYDIITKHAETYELVCNIFKCGALLSK
jgi:hypothetical protein